MDCFAQDNQLRLLLVDNALQQFGHYQRLHAAFRLNLNAAIGAQRQRGTNLLLAGLFTHRYSDHLSGGTGFLEAHGFFYSNFTEGVDGHLDVIEVNITTIGFGANLDVVINDALNGNKNLHGFSIDFSGGFRRAEPFRPNRTKSGRYDAHK